MICLSFRNPLRSDELIYVKVLLEKTFKNEKLWGRNVHNGDENHVPYKINRLYFVYANYNFQYMLLYRVTFDGLS